MIHHPEVDELANELDDLVSRWAARPLDDRPNIATVVGVLLCKAHALMDQAARNLEEGL